MTSEPLGGRPDWNRRRLKYCVSLVDDKVDTVPGGSRYVGLENIESWTGQYLVKDGPEGAGEGVSNQFKGGDILFGKLRPYLAKCFLPAWSGVCTSELLVLRPRAFEPRYLQFLMLSRPWIELVNSSTYGAKMPRASWEFVGNARVPVPPLEMQTEIARFLDRETVRIDELIAKNERLGELLEQERLTAIDSLVTREGCPQRRLKFCVARIEQGWSPQCENREADPDEWGVLKVSAVNYGRFRPEENKALPATELPLREYEIREGDVLMSRANTRALLGAAVCVPSLPGRLLLCDKLYRITPREDQLIPQYIPLALQTRYSRFQIEREATGASASMQNIGQDTVRNVVISTPTIHRQQELVSRVAEVEARIYSVAGRVVKAIDKLREYRTALMSAAVTGQIDVRTYRKEPEAVLEAT